MESSEREYEASKHYRDTCPEEICGEAPPYPFIINGGYKVPVLGHFHLSDGAVVWVCDGLVPDPGFYDHSDQCDCDPSLYGFPTGGYSSLEKEQSSLREPYDHITHRNPLLYGRNG